MNKENSVPSSSLDSSEGGFAGPCGFYCQLFKQKQAYEVLYSYIYDRYLPLGGEN